MKIVHKITFFTFLLAFSVPAFGQEDWEENDGEIEDVEIEIVKDREIFLPKASRNFEKIAPLNFSVQRPELDYFFSNLQLPIPALNIRVRPLRIKDEKLNKLYGNYVRAGFGNFVTPYVEGYFTSKRNRNYLYGTHVEYLNSQRGPINEDVSGSGRLNINAFGKTFGKKVTTSADLGLRRSNFNFYGVEIPPNVDFEVQEQVFNNFYVKASIENTDKTSDFDYLVGAQFDYLSDNFSATESEIQLDFDGRYGVGEYGSINLSTDFDIISQEDEQLDIDVRNLFRIRPSFTFEYEGFLIDAGLNVVYENDTLGNADDIHLYPLVKARYNLSSGLEVHAGIKGDVDKVTLRQLVRVNPFLAQNTRVFNSYNNFEFFGGVSGTLTSKLGFGTGISISSYSNMPFYLNSPSNQGEFVVAYDQGDVSVFNLNARMSYNNDEKLRLTLTGDYWGYDTDELEEAWHRPTYKLSALSTYTLVDKFRFESEIYLVGGIKAFDFITSETVDLDAFMDINLTSEYLVSDQFSVWLRLNNILSNEYEMLYNYPVRGFQFMVGASYSF